MKGYQKLKGYDGCQHDNSLRTVCFKQSTRWIVLGWRAAGLKEALSHYVL